MLLRTKKTRGVIPHDDGSCRREFVVTKLVSAKQKVYDKDGNFIREIDDVSISRSPIPVEDKFHLGQTAEMYQLGVLADAGVSTKLITNFDAPSLEQSSQVVDQLDGLTEKDFE